MKAYNNPQSREKQPTRDGGSKEQHDAKKAEQLANGGSLGDCEPGQGFNEGGNSAMGEDREKHDQPKMEGRRYVGGNDVGPAPVVESNIQLSERRHGAGNADLGSGSEPAGKAERATRLDMSVNRFEE